METEYLYQGQDLTPDILFKIEQIVGLLAARENRPFDECYRDFLNSRVDQTLRRLESLLWAESAEFIVDEYYRERDATGVGAAR
jgi:hypothetical protein